MIATLSSIDVRKINEKILTYLIVKLCYNGSDTDSVILTLCDAMDELVDSIDNTSTCVQQIRHSKPVS